MNLPTLNAIRFEQIGRALALLLVFWSPFSGGPRVFSALLAIMGGWLIYRERATLFAQSAMKRWSIIFLLLWIPLLVSVPGSLKLSHSLKIAASLPLYFLVGVALIYSLRRAENRLWLAKGIGLTLALWLVDGLVQYFFGRDLIGVPLTPDGRIVGAFGDNLHLALFLAVLAPVGLWLLLPARVVWAIGLYLVGAFVTLLSGSRMTIVMLLLVAAGVYWRATWRYKLPLLIVTLAAVAGLVALASNHLLVQERLERTRAIGEWTFTGIDTALSGRLTIWETAGRMFADRPLTGVGAGAFRSAYDRYATRPDDPFRGGGGFEGGVYHAHQMYISIAAESGVIGLAAVLCALFLGVKWYFAAPPGHRRRAWPFAFSLLVAVFPVNSQPVIYTHWWFPVLLLLLCASLAAVDPAADSLGSETRRKQDP